MLHHMEKEMYLFYYPDYDVYTENIIIIGNPRLKTKLDSSKKERRKEVRFNPTEQIFGNIIINDSFSLPFKVEDISLHGMKIRILSSIIVINSINRDVDLELKIGGKIIKLCGKIIWIDNNRIGISIYRNYKDYVDYALYIRDKYFKSKVV